MPAFSLSYGIGNTLRALEVFEDKALNGLLDVLGAALGRESLGLICLSEVNIGEAS